MAEISVPSSMKKSLQKNPGIDLTPLVDLGFLLITFFIFTASLSNPTTLNTLLPADSKDSTRVAASGTISLIPDADQVYFYVGSHPEDVQRIAYNSPGNLREALIAVQQSLIATDGNDEKLFVMIKPSSDAPFGAVVALLDEMKICNLKRYTLADLQVGEYEKLIAFNP